MGNSNHGRQRPRNPSRRGRTGYNGRVSRPWARPNQQRSRPGYSGRVSRLQARSNQQRSRPERMEKFESNLKDAAPTVNEEYSVVVIPFPELESWHLHGDRHLGHAIIDAVIETKGEVEASVTCVRLPENDQTAFGAENPELVLNMDGKSRLTVYRGVRPGVVNPFVDPLEGDYRVDGSKPKTHGGGIWGKQLGGHGLHKVRFDGWGPAHPSGSIVEAKTGICAIVITLKNRRGASWKLESLQSLVYVADACKCLST